MVYFYIFNYFDHYIIHVPVHDWLIRRTSPQPCTPPPLSCTPSIPPAVSHLSPIFTCLADCNSCNADLPAIHLFPFQSTIHTNEGLKNLLSLSPAPYHHFLISCYTALMSLCFSFCLGCSDLLTPPLHIYLYPKIHFSVSIF